MASRSRNVCGNSHSIGTVEVTVSTVRVCMLLSMHVTVTHFGSLCVFFTTPRSIWFLQGSLDSMDIHPLAIFLLKMLFRVCSCFFNTGFPVRVSPAKRIDS